MQAPSTQIAVHASRTAHLQSAATGMFGLESSCAMMGIAARVALATKSVQGLDPGGIAPPDLAASSTQIAPLAFARAIISACSVANQLLLDPAYSGGPLVAKLEIAPMRRGVDAATRGPDNAAVGAPEPGRERPQAPPRAIARQVPVADAKRPPRSAAAQARGAGATASAAGSKRRPDLPRLIDPAGRVTAASVRNTDVSSLFYARLLCRLRIDSAVGSVLM